MELAERVSVWYQTVLRADREQIVVGAGTNLQDGTVVHADPGFPTTLGENEMRILSYLLRQHRDGNVVKPSEISTLIMDRPRHAKLIEEVRKTGCSIRLITDGDVAGAMIAAREGSAIDLLYGIGGTPEGVLAAAVVFLHGGLGRVSAAVGVEVQFAVCLVIETRTVVVQPTPWQVLTEPNWVSGFQTFPDWAGRSRPFLHIIQRRAL